MIKYKYTLIEVSIMKVKSLFFGFLFASLMLIIGYVSIYSICIDWYQNPTEAS